MVITFDPLLARHSWLDTNRHVYLLIGFSLASHVLFLTTTVISLMAVMLDVGFVLLGFLIHQHIYHVTQQSNYQNVALPRETKNAMYTAFVLRCLRDIIIANIALLNLAGLHMMLASGPINIITITVILCVSIYWRYTKWVNDCKRVDDGEDFIERIKHAPEDNTNTIVKIKQQKGAFSECCRHLAILRNESTSQDEVILAQHFRNFLELVVRTLPHLWISESKQLFDLALKDPCFLWCLQQRSVNKIANKKMLKNIANFFKESNVLKDRQMLATLEYYSLDHYYEKVEFIRDNFIGGIIDIETLAKYFMSCDIGTDRAMAITSQKWQELHSMVQNSVISNMTEDLMSKSTHTIQSAFSCGNVERIYILLLNSPNITDDTRLRALYSIMLYGKNIKSYIPSLLSMLVKELSVMDKVVLKESDMFSKMVSALCQEPFIGYPINPSITDTNVLEGDENVKLTHIDLDLVFDVLKDSHDLKVFIKQYNCLYQYLHWQIQCPENNADLDKLWLKKLIQQSLLNFDNTSYNMVSMIPELIKMFARKNVQSSFIHVLTLFHKYVVSSSSDLISTYLASQSLMTDEDNQWIKCHVIEPTVQHNLQEYSFNTILHLMQAGGFDPKCIQWKDYFSTSKEHALKLMAHIIEDTHMGLSVIIEDVKRLSQEQLMVLFMSVNDGAKANIRKVVPERITFTFSDWRKQNKAQSDSTVIKDAFIQYSSVWSDLDSIESALSPDDKKDVIEHLASRPLEIPWKYWKALNQDQMATWFFKCQPCSTQQAQYLSGCFVNYITSHHGATIPIRMLRHATDIWIHNYRQYRVTHEVIQRIFIESARSHHSKISWLENIPDNFWNDLADPKLTESLLSPFINKDNHDPLIHLFYIRHINEILPDCFFILKDIPLHKCDNGTLRRINDFLVDYKEEHFSQVANLIGHYRIQPWFNTTVQSVFSSLCHTTTTEQKKLNRKKTKSKPTLPRFLIKGPKI